MELVVDFSIRRKYYYVRLIDHGMEFISDHSIAKELGISDGDYHDLIVRNGGYIFHGGLVFSTQEDCLRARDELDIYLVMKKLEK